MEPAREVPDRAPVVTLPQAVAFAEELRTQRKRIVAVSGSFDVFHAGHVAFLSEARAQGDALVVFLNSDVSIRGYKGPTRPIVQESERALLLSSLRVVDRVVLFDDLTPLHCIDALRPDIYVNGADRGYCVERAVLDTYGGKLHTVEKGSLSSSKLIERVSEAERNAPVRVLFIPLDAYSDSLISFLNTTNGAKYTGVLMHDGTAEDEEMCRGLIEKHASLKSLNRATYAHTTTPGEYDPSFRIVDYAREQGITLDKSWVISPHRRDIWDARLINTGAIKLGVEEAGDIPAVPYSYAPTLTDALTTLP